MAHRTDGTRPLRVLFGHGCIHDGGVAGLPEHRYDVGGHPSKWPSIALHLLWGLSLGVHRGVVRTGPEHPYAPPAIRAAAKTANKAEFL